MKKLITVKEEKQRSKHAWAQELGVERERKKAAVLKLSAKCG